MSHTPGPWEAIGTAVHAESGREIIFNAHNTRSGEPDERKANARLIAAAPDLLAACEEALECGYHADGCKWFNLLPPQEAKRQGKRSFEDAGPEDCDCFLSLCKSAIAKARGK